MIWRYVKTFINNVPFSVHLGFISHNLYFYYYPHGTELTMNSIDQKLIYKPSNLRRIIDFFDFGYSISVSRLNLLVAIGLAAFYNPMLWHYLLAQERIFSVEGIYFVLAFVISLISVFYVGLSLISFKKIQKVAISCILFTAATASFFMSHYGTVIDSNMIEHISNLGFNGFVNEIKISFLVHMLLLGFFPCFWISQAKINYKSTAKCSPRISLSVVSGLIIGAVVLLPQYHDFSGFFKSHKDLKCRIVPLNVLYYSSSYITHLIPKEYKKLHTNRSKPNLLATDGSE